MKIETDEEIINLFLNRSEQAITAVHNKYGGYCYHIAFHILRSHQDTEECINDILLTCWNSIPRQKPICFQAYIATITRNIALTQYRKLHAKSRYSGQAEWTLFDYTVPSKAAVTTDLCESIALEQCIDSVLKTCTPDDQQIFYRRYYEEQQITTLAQEYALTESCVKVRLLRMRNKLKQKLVKEGLIP